MQRRRSVIQVRVTMRADSSDNLVQPFDRILGHAEIHFSSLMNEETVYGWFPLRPHKASITNVENFQTCGSIKLRLRWVHSQAGLARYTEQRLKARLHELHLQQQAQAVMMMEVFTGKNQTMSQHLTTPEQGGERDNMESFEEQRGQEANNFDKTNSALSMAG